MVDLVTDYMRDLEIEIAQNAELILSGRIDLVEYDKRCRAELDSLRNARKNGDTVGLDRYGTPSVEAGKAAEKEALKLIAAVLTSGNA